MPAASFSAMSLVERAMYSSIGSSRTLGSVEWIRCTSPLWPVADQADVADKRAAAEDFVLRSRCRLLTVAADDVHEVAVLQLALGPVDLLVRQIDVVVLSRPGCSTSSL